MKKTVLKNGITVITKKIPTSNSVSLGFWVKTGSIHESKEESGYAHFLEHMMFKGTKKRSAKEIAHVIDSAGAYINAGTSKEYTSYYINIIDTKINLALDILTDILGNSTFQEKEIKKERQVVLEEISMYEDTPSELVHDKLIEAMLWKHPIGHPILGQTRSIKKVSRNKLVKFFKRRYSPDKILITAAGNVSHENLLRYLRKVKFFSNTAQNKTAENEVENKIQSRNIILDKELAQVHFCMGFPSIPITHKLRHSLYILNAIFGSSMSSRLFQRIREDQGLCYSIYSFNSMYMKNGIFGIYAGTGLPTFEKTLTGTLKEIKKLKKKLVLKEEMQNGKEHLKGNMALAYENINTHMNSLARQEIYYGKQASLKQQIKNIDKVSLESIEEVINTIFPDDYKIIISSIGNKNHRKIINNIDLHI
jgi:predicted Zn-dependent peptidase